MKPLHCLVASLLFIGAAQGEKKAVETIPLLVDTPFVCGFIVWLTLPGRKVKRSYPTRKLHEYTFWGLAQWYSRFTLVASTPVWVHRWCGAVF